MPFKIKKLNGREKRVYFKDTCKEFVLKVDPETFGIDRVVQGVQFQIMDKPFLVYLFTFECDNDLGSGIGLQKIKGFIKCIGFVITCRVYLIADRLSRTHVYSSISYRVDTGILIYHQGNDVVFAGFTQIFKIRTRRDDVGDITFDVGHFSFLFDNNDRIFFSCYEAGEVSVQRDSRYPGKQRIVYRVFKNSLAFSCKLDIKQFGDLFGFTDLEVIVVDLIDFKKSADLHEDQSICSVLFLKMALQVKVDFC